MRVLVAGASRGIGRAVCRRLAAQAQSSGEALQIAACGSRHPDELLSLKQELETGDVSVATLTGDLADPTVPALLVAQALEALGGLDAVVANAGISRVGTLDALGVAEWDELFAVNVRSIWLLCQAAHPALAAAGGSIVTIGSMSGVQPQPSLGAYSVSKAAVIMLTRLMAQEWGGDGIRVNCASPGMVITPMTEATYRDGEFRAAREAMAPAGRIADPDQDIAGVVCFLLGGDAGYVTGVNLLADGGVSDSMLRVLPARRS